MDSCWRVTVRRGQGRKGRKGKAGCSASATHRHHRSVLRRCQVLSRVPSMSSSLSRLRFSRGYINTYILQSTYSTLLPPFPLFSLSCIPKAPETRLSVCLTTITVQCAVCSSSRTPAFPRLSSGASYALRLAPRLQIQSPDTSVFVFSFLSDCPFV
ncbi:hypothetical protein DM02DRAFT_118910 [Periconia macrospinosa]|uniref:Uncharacterized protein n=1 Tax=Periconia macrospinosa TaxID=97972 RepID=A0A2V1DE11_9PLEO|nr:hypothetical protein DM02DRAFT_118910 [Periconia macrospinosa]